MSGREVCNKAANFCALLAQAMEAGAGEPGPGGRLRQCEREFRAWARDLEESPEIDALNRRVEELTEFLRESDRSKAEAWQRKLATPMCAYGCASPTFGEAAAGAGWDGKARGQAFEDALQPAWLEHVRTCPNHPQRAVELERDSLQAQLDAQTKASEKALARVKHIEWEMKGSPMKGETP